MCRFMVDESLRLEELIEFRGESPERIMELVREEIKKKRLNK